MSVSDIKTSGPKSIDDSSIRKTTSAPKSPVFTRPEERWSEQAIKTRNREPSSTDQKRAQSTQGKTNRSE